MRAVTRNGRLVLAPLTGSSRRRNGAFFSVSTRIWAAPGQTIS